MFQNVKKQLQQEIEEIKASGLYKAERILVTPQGAEIKTDKNEEVLNFCANNYLGLSSHPDVIKSAHKAIDSHGFGSNAGRHLAGTAFVHVVDATNRPPLPMELNWKAWG